MKKIIISIIIIIIAAGLLGCGADDSEDGLCKIVFFDVGQGDSCLIISANGSNVLIDTGDGLENGLITDKLKSFGVKVLDLLIITHGHSDHSGGFTEVLSNFAVKNIITLEGALSSVDLKRAQLKGTAIKNAVYENALDLDGISFEFIWPREVLDSFENDNCVVAVAEVNGRRLLFTADVGVDEEAKIIESHPDLSCDVLKVGHHGSESSTSDVFLDIVSPSYAVISVGKNNRFGLPDNSVLERLSKRGITLFRTDIDGDVYMTVDKEGKINIKN